ncbi:MAG: hypothetical protein AB1696_08570 [Planctomycetota bacterium]
MVEILNPRHGAIMCRHDGEETEGALTITVTGCADPFAPVTVNGIEAERCGAEFSAPVRLTRKINEITAQVKTVRGIEAQTIKVVWDKKSFKRYRFFIDDHSFFLQDLATHSYGSIFECFYLDWMRTLHERYGAKIVLNCFFRNDHDKDGFEITAVPDKHKGEWRDNAEWLNLSFHAFSEFPDRPYNYPCPAKLAEDYDRVKEQIVRFAGEETFCPPIVTHWAVCHPANFGVLKERGAKVLCGQFINAFVGKGYRPLSPFGVSDVGYHLDEERSAYLWERRVIHDMDYDITFMKGTVCCNRNPVGELLQQMEEKYASPHAIDILGIASHEQYSFPFYRNYLPDHFERMDSVCRSATEHGYKPVWFHEGFLGNPTLAPES